ncbi:MAG: hypothetical protein ACM3YM_06005 [Sphingomonadales bacterium]
MTQATMPAERSGLLSQAQLYRLAELTRNRDNMKRLLELAAAYEAQAFAIRH